MDPAEALDGPQADLDPGRTSGRRAQRRHARGVDAARHRGRRADRARAPPTVGGGRRPPVRRWVARRSRSSRWRRPSGSVFAVRDDARMVCAVTAGDPTVGLIFYDLKTCLRNIAEEPVEAVGGGAGGGAGEEEEPMARGKLAAIAVATASVLGTVARAPPPPPAPDARRPVLRRRLDAVAAREDAPESAAILPAAHAILAVSVT